MLTWFLPFFLSPGFIPSTVTSTGLALSRRVGKWASWKGQGNSAPFQGFSQLRCPGSAFSVPAPSLPGVTSNQQVTPSRIWRGIAGRFCKQRVLGSDPSCVAASSSPLSLSLPIFRMGEHCWVASRPVGGCGFSQRRQRGGWMLATFALGLPRDPGPSVPGAGKGVGARAGRDGAFVPCHCLHPGPGKPVGAGLGAGPSTG